MSQCMHKSLLNQVSSVLLVTGQTIGKVVCLFSMTPHQRCKICGRLLVFAHFHESITSTTLNLRMNIHLVRCIYLLFFLKDFFFSRCLNYEIELTHKDGKRSETLVFPAGVFAQ